MLILIALLSLEGAAGEDPIRAVFSDYEKKSLACLLERTKQGLPSTLDERCHYLTPEQVSSTNSLKDVFCNNPIAFCDKAEALSDDERFLKLVNSRCEVGVTWTRVTGRLDGPIEEKLYQAAFGCKEVGTYLEGAHRTEVGKEPAIVREFRCQKEEFRFPCDMKNVKSEEQESDLFRRFLLSHHGSAQSNSDGSCKLTIARPLVLSKPLSVSRAPLLRAVETIGDRKFKAELKGEVQQGMDDLGSTFIQLSQDTHTDVFESLSKLAYTPNRLANLEKLFATAKRAVVDSLNALQPPAPAAVLKRVMDIRLLDPRKPDDFARIRASCGGWLGGGSFEPNASLEDSGDPTKPNEMLICPGFMLSFDLGSPDEFFPIILHEIGHSLDPAILGHHLLANSTPTKDCVIPTDTPSQELFGFHQRVTAFSECVSDASKGQYVRKGSRAVFARFMKKFKDTEGLPENIKRAAGCFENAFLLPSEGGTGLVRALNGLPSLIDSPVGQEIEKYNPALFKEIQAWLWDGPRTLGNGLDQEGEAFADWIASISLTKALQLDNLVDDDRRANLLVSLTAACGLRNSGELWDPHPAFVFRMDTLGSAGSIRTVLGCGSPSREGNTFPTGCGMSSGGAP